MKTEENASNYTKLNICFTIHGHQNLPVPFKFFLAAWANELLPKEKGLQVGTTVFK
jgi:hypothetical protein